MEIVPGRHIALDSPERGMRLLGLVNDQKSPLLLALGWVACALAVSKFVGPVPAVAAAAALPVLFMMLLNPESLLIGTILSVFVAFQVRYTEISVYMAFPFLAAIAVNRVPGESLAPRSNPLAKPFFIYLLAILPSLMNTSDVFFSLFSMINLFAMALIAHLIGEFVQDEGKLKRGAAAYVAACVVNGAVVIATTIAAGGRSFGFTKIVYVDLVCVGIIVVIMMIIAMRRTHLVSLSLVAGFLMVALIFTQTRNTLISLAAALGFLFVYLLRRGERFGIEKKRLLVSTGVMLALAAAAVLFLFAVSPQLFERLGEIGSKRSVELRSETDFGTNSLMTRFLLWHTALNGFLRHPIAGIGAFSFIRESRFYFTIPTPLYKLFVEGISPHEGYLEVLVETGIIGFTAFVAFLVAAFRMGLRIVRKARTSFQLHTALGLLVLQVYILFSMLMTDSWLVGQCGMVWGIVLGFSIALNNMIDRQAVADGPR